MFAHLGCKKINICRVYDRLWVETMPPFGGLDLCYIVMENATVTEGGTIFCTIKYKREIHVV
jgi:hypothetical protein